MNRYIRLLCFASVCAVTGAATTALAASDMIMKPGLWRHTVEVNIPGVAQVMQPIEVDQCVTPEEASDWEGTLKAMRAAEKDGSCSLGDVARDGDTVRWTMSCTGKTELTGQGEMTYRDGERYSGNMVMAMNGPQGAMEMTQHLRGERVGECQQ